MRMCSFIFQKYSKITGWIDKFNECVNFDELLNKWMIEWKNSTIRKLINEQRKEQVKQWNR